MEDCRRHCGREHALLVRWNARFPLLDHSRERGNRNHLELRSEDAFEQGKLHVHLVLAKGDVRCWDLENFSQTTCQNPSQREKSCHLEVVLLLQALNCPHDFLE